MTPLKKGVTIHLHVLAMGDAVSVAVSVFRQVLAVARVLNVSVVDAAAHLQGILVRNVRRLQMAVAAPMPVVIWDFVDIKLDRRLSARRRTKVVEAQGLAS